MKFMDFQEQYVDLSQRAVILQGTYHDVTEWENVQSPLKFEKNYIMNHPNVKSSPENVKSSREHVKSS